MFRPADEPDRVVGACLVLIGDVVCIQFTASFLRLDAITLYNQMVYQEPLNPGAVVLTLVCAVIGGITFLALGVLSKEIFE